jgi:uncharacterized NAD-dependent epimerase/dehydratase family protein
VQSITVQIIGREGCHLCDDAEGVVESVVAGFKNVTIQHSVLEDNPEWVQTYADKIPVVQIDGVEFAYWRVRAPKLEAALIELGGQLVNGLSKEG